MKKFNEILNEKMKLYSATYIVPTSSTKQALKILKQLEKDPKLGIKEVQSIGLLDNNDLGITVMGNANIKQIEAKIRSILAE